MKQIYRKLEMKYLQSTKKEKTLFFVVLWSIFLIILWFFYFWIQWNKIKDTNTLTQTKTGSIKQEINDTIINSESELNLQKITQNNTSFIWKKIGIEENLISQNQKLSEGNYDLKLLIQTSNKSDLKEVLLSIYKLPSLNNRDISEVNRYLEKYKYWKIDFFCNKNLCSLPERIQYLEKIQKINSTYKDLENKNISNIKKINLKEFKSLNELKFYLTRNYSCSEDDILKQYDRKLRFLHSNKDLISDIKEVSSFDKKNILLQYRSQLDTITKKWSFRISGKDLKALLDLKRYSYKLNLNRQLQKIEYIKYNWKNIEVEVIKSLLGLEKFKYPSDYIFRDVYTKAEKGSLKLYIPLVRVFSGKSILQTLDILLVDMIKSTCNNLDSFKVIDYKTDISENWLLERFIWYKKTLKLYSLNTPLEKMKKDLLYKKEFWIIFDFVFIY